MGRDEKAVDVLMNYAPDVVGLQETSPNCRSTLEPLFGSSPYKMIGKHNTVMYSKYDNINFSSIIYNSDTVKSIGNCTNITILIRVQRISKLEFPCYQYDSMAKDGKTYARFLML